MDHSPNNEFQEGGCRVNELIKNQPKIKPRLPQPLPYIQVIKHTSNRLPQHFIPRGLAHDHVKLPGMLGQFLKSMDETRFLVLSDRECDFIDYGILEIISEFRNKVNNRTFRLNLNRIASVCDGDSLIEKFYLANFETCKF